MMTHVVNTSGRGVSANPRADADEAESLLHHGDIAEAFDEIARRRFGQMISAAALKPTKRR